jgi:uncharacterized protein YcbX
MATLTHIFRFPIKSIGTEALDRVTLSKGAALPWDRRWALAHGAGEWDPANPKWMACKNFTRVSHVPRYAQLGIALDEATGEVSLTHPDLPPLTARPDTAEGAAAVAAWIEPLASEGRPGPFQIAHAPDVAMTDADEPWLSIKSLSSLQDLSEKAGMDLSLHRFRSNLWVEGLEPWAEFDWIGKEVTIGPVRLRITEEIERCATTAADPETGERNAGVPQLLKQTYGHMNFGVYAEVLEGGEIAIGDAVTPPGPSPLPARDLPLT